MKRILIIHLEGNSYANPTLKAFIDYSIRCGVLVDIIRNKSSAKSPVVTGLKWITYPRIWSGFKTIVGKYICSQFISSMVAAIESRFLSNETYDIVIGVDREGIIDAYYFGVRSNIPYLLFSFEIMFERETSVRYKQLERHASRCVALWVTQDAERKTCLMQENSLSAATCYICPVSSSGLGRHSDKRLRDRLGIPPNRKVAISIGSVATWTMTLEIIAGLSRWPSNWVLIIHERHGRAEELLREINPGGRGLLSSRLYFSDVVVDAVDEMGFVFAGINVGLGFYRPDYSSRFSGDNVKYLGLSSGKIATYLRYSIPVIVNEIGLYADEIKKHECGAVVNIEELPSLLGGLDLERMAENAASYFAKNLDAGLYIPRLFDRIASLSP